MYQLSILFVPLDRLLRIFGHAHFVILASVYGQLVGDGTTPPVVLGYLAVVLVLQGLMSWDPLKMYTAGALWLR